MENSKLKVKVVMLATQSKSKLVATPNGLSYYELGGRSCAHSDGFAQQHLYFVSNREIKEGDYCFMFDDLGNLFICNTPQKYEPNKGHILNNGLRKIEATSDPSLGLPLIPESFVRKYVEEQGNIKEVDIDKYSEYLSGEELNNKHVIDGLIVRSDNTVIVSKVKDTWTKEEVIKLCISARSDILASIIINTPSNFKKWIEDNL